jgi:glucose/arabinose dehydrogenase
MALPPDFPANPYVYVLYAHDAAIGGTAPRWGAAGATSDPCPTPPGPTSDGCVVSGRLSRLQAAGNVMTGSEQVLIEDWCQQYPSHSVGDLAFGADGALYVSGGDGASFTFTDYGQDGNPLNPCGDPPGGIGAALTPPSAEGGALRSQDVRTSPSTPAPGPSTTHILRPNADITSQWVVGGGGPAWDALNEAVTQPSSVPVEKFIYEGVLNKVTEVALTDPTLSGDPTAGKAWFYGNVAPNSAVRVDVIWGGSVRGGTTLTAGSSGLSYAWRSIDVIPPDQAAANDLRLRFSITQGAQFSSNVFAAYYELTAPGSGGGGGGTGTDPTGLSGAILRVDPATGAGLSGNPFFSSSDPNARRIVAFGLRNPFRITTRPGTGEIWIGDVGQGAWEEVDRIVNPTDGTADNFGWPCHEGPERQGGFDSANLTLCESLYTNPTGLVGPHHAYDHAARVVAGETCPTGSSAIAGMTFYTGGPFPDEYDNALFFVDNSRDCIWAMRAGSNGLPDPSDIVTFDAGAGNPVDVVMGPDGNLYYPDFEAGTIQRISFAAANEAPTAVAEATPSSGPVPLTVNFDGTASSDPDIGDTLTYAWDLDSDGQYDDSTAAQPSHTFTTAGVRVVGLRVRDPAGNEATATVTVHAGNTPPVANITAPGANSLWRVGQGFTFAGTGTDAQDGALAASRYSWQLNMEHCPSNCHTHFLNTYPGVTGGSFTTPDHEYPSHIALKLTVTDLGGLTDTDVLHLDPRTVGLTLRTLSPAGLQLTLNSTTATTPFTQTVIQGSNNSISAPSPQTVGPSTYSWVSWSDGGARTHNVIAGANRKYTATYQASGGAAFALAKKRLGKCLKKLKRAQMKGKKRKKKRKRCFVRFGP